MWLTSCPESNRADERLGDFALIELGKHSFRYGDDKARWTRDPGPFPATDLTIGGARVSYGCQYPGQSSFAARSALTDRCYLAPLQTLNYPFNMDRQIQKTSAALSVLGHLRDRMAKKSTARSVPPRSLTDFIEAFAQYSSTSIYLKCFRGQKNSSWQNVAGIFRPDLTELLKNEKRAVRDLISVHPNEFASDETMFDKLVRMQHFGLPTRLLDVSLNALVALYFATESGPISADGKVTAFAIPPTREKYFDSDSVSCLANLSNMTTEEKGEIYRLREELKGDISSAGNIGKFNTNEVIKRLHQFIRSEKPYFLPIIDPIDLFKPYYVHPKMSNRRILAQSGAFILYGMNPPRKMYFPDTIDETPFIVPKGEKTTIRRELEKIGISESTLYPEIDKVAARIKNQYRKK